MRIGILGGTFDPIHYGHIRPGLEVKTALKLDKLLLMPNHIAPHKQVNTSTAQRLEMVAQVCSQIEGFELCDIEAKRDTPSYTVVTLKELQTLYPNDELFFIMGMDSFIQLNTWYQWQQLFELANIVVCCRPGWLLPAEHPMQQVLSERLAPAMQNQSLANQEPSHGRIYTVDVNPQDISSTDIRRRLALGDLPEEALLPITLEYIQKQRLYFS
ncbi:nicotinate-nucleotide adenylyltransferase [Shewanella acanthi]|uniref:nicotinate-nucleotide adenylyltransferase n=1 Tax=Shewanella acanthi TaxID=2864212 RepID=UPI001C65FC16|nr:nicotinate-nucleotide adenylyltransferase [Shewanella acanthi]QYJ79645.1 nicotinate-nucleotide adenylyltransferase [Shewanella acanthi]